MALLAKQLSSDAGLAIAFTAASGGGDTMPIDDHTVLLVNNGSGSPINVTLSTPGTVGGLAIADRVVAVAAGAIEAIGPLTEVYDDTDTGGADITYSSVTTVTVACLTIPG